MHRNTLHTSRTPDNNKIASWRLLGGTARILGIQLRGELFAGFRYPDTPIPDAPAGLIIFDSDRTPDLATARELFPRHDELWNVVRADYWAAVSVFGSTAQQRYSAAWRCR